VEPSHSNEIEAFCRQHGPALLLFAAAMTWQPDPAQEAVHQVFLKLIEDGKRRNAVLNEVKIQTQNAALAEDSAWFDPPNRDYAGELNLRRAVGSIPDDQQEVTVLHVWGKLTFAQIGGLLDINPNTAASRYRYALAKLLESMCTKEDTCANS
jgi:DNA-directed RNA polymerase specialized sigma24 family protein